MFAGLGVDLSQPPAIRHFELVLKVGPTAKENQTGFVLNQIASDLVST